MQNFVILAALLTTSLAQYGAAQSSATATGSSSATTHSIKVGQTNIVFEPDTVTAAVGDILDFQFFNDEHSVAQADFSGPCKPMSSNNGGIFSGFPGSGKVFQVVVNSTDPMWLYCSEEGHCQGGMVMVVNQAGGNTLDAFKTAAQSSGGSSAPANVQGGVIEPISALSSSASAAASSTAASMSSAASSASAAATSAAGGAGETIGKGFQMTGLAAAIAALGWLI